jgi:hypothetical protein
VDNWKVRFEKTLPYMEQVKDLVRTELPVADDVPIEETSLGVDQKTASDLVIHLPQPQTVAVRLRSPEFLRFADEFTLRTSGGRGVSELEKIRKGYAHLLFYGFAVDGLIVKWRIADLDVFRKFYEDPVRRSNVAPGQERGNRDGSSFRVFRFDHVERFGRFVLAQDGIQVAA